MQTRNYTSLVVHTIYCVLIGLQLIFVPNMILNMFGITETSEIWISVLGIVVASLAFVYYPLSKSGDKKVVAGSAYARLTVCAGFVFLALTGRVEMTLILFAGIDLATAVWTLMELKKG